MCSSDLCARMLSDEVPDGCVGKGADVMRDEVARLIALGPLPGSSSDEEVIRAHEGALAEVRAPVSTEEARAMLSCFGTDDCYGLAWTLLHLVESAPVSPLERAPDAGSNEWLFRLWHRLGRATESHQDHGAVRSFQKIGRAHV